MNKDIVRSVSCYGAISIRKKDKFVICCQESLSIDVTRTKLCEEILCTEPSAKLRLACRDSCYSVFPWWLNVFDVREF